MPSPTWFFDGDLRVAYEVPPGASFVMSGQYRVYDGGPAESPILSVDVQRDLWSRWVDWHALNDWAAPAFARSGGNLRPTGEYAPADFTLLTSLGWRLVLADYPHETIFAGNLFPEGADSLFDNARLTVPGIVPRLSGSANLLTYRFTTGGADADDIADKVWAHASAVAMVNRLVEVWGRLGLDPSKPLVQGDTQFTFGDVILAVTEADGQVTVTRQ